jgi:hypothetical protein
MRLRFALPLVALALLAPGSARAQSATATVGGPPALSGCGTSPSVSGSSNAIYGTVTEGTGSPTGCTLTWQTAPSNQPGAAPAGALTRQNAAPTCLVTGRTSTDLVTAITTANGTTLTWTNAATNSGVYDYFCPTM